MKEGNTAVTVTRISPRWEKNRNKSAFAPPTITPPSYTSPFGDSSIATPETFEVLSNFKSHDLEGATATESEENSCYVDVDKNNVDMRQSQTKAEPFNRYKTMGDRLELPSAHPRGGRRSDDLPRTIIQALRGKSAQPSEESIILTGIEELPGHECTPPDLDRLTSHDSHHVSIGDAIEESSPNKFSGAKSE